MKSVGVGGGVWRTEKVFKTPENEFRMFRSEVEPLGNNDSEEDAFFASLTRCLGKVSLLDLYMSPEVSGGSPQSTLGGIGSWSGRSSNGSNHNSPPATPFESREDTLRLIYAAARQVARLERNVEDPLQASLNGQWRALAMPNPIQNQEAGYYADLQMMQNYLAVVRQANEAAMFWENHLHNLNRYETNCSPRCGACPEILNQSAWPPLQQARGAVKPNLSAVSLQRKESAGTGVFIPRRYEADTSLPPRKRPAAPYALVPAKVVHALNTSIETLNACSRAHSNPNSRGDSISQQSFGMVVHSNPNSRGDSISQRNFDALMSRRRTLLDQQRGSMTRTEDIGSRSLEACLPPEWSY